MIVDKIRLGVLLLLAMVLTVQAGSAKTMLPGYAVSSAHPLATQAGLEILAHGGNAFDAAVAISAALAVVEPYHSGLGGGGFWLLHQADTKKNIFIDGREVAPMAASKNMYIASDGTLQEARSLNGGLAAAIPGEPAALVWIAQHYGRLPLAVTLAPAIRFAESGFPVDQQLYYFLTMSDRQQQLAQHAASAEIFLQNGKPYPIGSLLIQKDLAKTLRQIATHGHDGFYRGTVAKQLVDAVNQAGGIWSLQDLERYAIKVREPLYAQFHDLRVITAPLPSGGGIALVTMLNILSEYPLQTFSQVQWVHYLVESMRLAYWQRSQFLADPDFVAVPLQNLLSKANARYLRSLIPPARAIDNTTLKTPVILPGKSSSTTHFSVIDAEGNRVAATMSINYIFGSSVVAKGTGVLLNDEMNDFSIDPTTKNVFGLIGGEANSIAPGKRPLSSMTPTFLEMPHRLAILGTPGGSRIPTMVLLATLSFYDTYGAISMVSRMRFHHQYLPDEVQFEPDTFPLWLQQQLRTMGYHLVALKQYYGDMQAITWDEESQLITASSDPRHIGLSAVMLQQNTGGYGVTH